MALLQQIAEEGGKGFCLDNVVRGSFGEMPLFGAVSSQIELSMCGAIQRYIEEYGTMSR